MRIIIAFLLGITVTIGGAYFHDAAIAGPTDKKLVNWDQFGEMTHTAMETVRTQWNKLTAR